MQDFVRIIVPEKLLPQVLSELLQFAADPNLVEVAHETNGRVIHAHTAVANAWYRTREELSEGTAEVTEKPAEVSPEVVSRAAEKVLPETPPAVTVPKKRTTTSA